MKLYRIIGNEGRITIPYSIQYYVDGNRLVIEAVDEEECLPRRRNGCCPCQNCCEDAFR